MYELIDKSTGLPLGPYTFLSEARAQASRFRSWEIVDLDGRLVCEGENLDIPERSSDEAYIPH